MDIEKYLKGLSPELQEKARACKSTDELRALAEQEGVALPPEALAAIAGGNDPEVGKCSDVTCPLCGSKNYEYEGEQGLYYYYQCRDCQYEWKVPGLFA